MEDDKIEKTLDSINQNLGKINETLYKHDKTLDQLIVRQITHDENIKDLKEKVGKLELMDSHIIDKEDYMIKLLENMTAEQAANKHRSDRHEERIEVLEKDVKQLQVAVLP